MSDSGFPIPPPTLEFLILSIKMQAEMRLGLMTMGDEQNEGPDIPAARHAIDMLAMLSEKTKGNLTLEEQRLMENTLMELRFRFVQVSQKVAASASSELTAEPTAESGATDS
ncbi:MAG: DUF1844 domain-containing protein [Acidobacteriota bacterium]